MYTVLGSTMSTPPHRRTPRHSLRFSLWRLALVALMVAGAIAFFVFGLDNYLSFKELGVHRE